MQLTLDVISLGVPDVAAARTFYTDALAPAVTEHDDHVMLDLHGTARIALHEQKALAVSVGTAAEGSGFRRFVISYIVDQPGEVAALVESAARAGARVLKPAKKSLFAGFSGVFQAPDGAIWKVASAHRKDTATPAVTPRPFEVGALLAVETSQGSKAFYAAEEMRVERDYGNKYVDLTVAPGTARLGLLPVKLLAKDVNVDAAAQGDRGLVLEHRAGSREHVEDLLSTAGRHGGRVVAPAAEGHLGWVGVMEDADGFLWRVSAL